VRRLVLLLAISFLPAVSGDRNCQIIEFPELPSLTSGGDTVRFLGHAPVREGGWSALTRDPLDPTGRTLWAVNDRGLNIPLESGGREIKVFPAPAYHQKLMKLHLDGSQLHIQSFDSLTMPGKPTRHVDGLPSSRLPNGEIAWRQDPRTGRPDSSPPIPPSPYGLDIEGLRLGTKIGYLSEEYGPSLLEFDRATLRILRQWSPGKGLPPVLATRRPNHGFEGLALTPSGRLVGLMESPLWNWVGKRKKTRDSRIVRMVRLDPRTGKVEEFALLSDPRREGRHVKYGDLVALDEQCFLVVEHGKLLDGTVSMDLWLVDLTGATDITSPLPQGRLFHQGRKTLEELMDSAGLASHSIQSARKTIVRADFGRQCGWPALKPEGIEILDDSTAVLINDNDFGLDRTESSSGDGIPHADTGPSGRSSLLLLSIPSVRETLIRP